MRWNTGVCWCSIRKAKSRKVDSGKPHQEDEGSGPLIRDFPSHEKSINCRWFSHTCGYDSPKSHGELARLQTCKRKLRVRRKAMAMKAWFGVFAKIISSMDLGGQIHVGHEVCLKFESGRVGERSLKN
ncbi:hypothetical protein CDL15_Pgr022315 [Punica granatum]|uniref:Uncharacterized protein n=1 Tax=Punica granatum TaxID=22663 RepID=A0A218W350_PUNGR|nr:hypothetical protein CDL15_Pgr022315 [Punica granatum]PKI74460.1 hypothetical protein CRG98_005142 [Punica granatum]